MAEQYQPENEPFSLSQDKKEGVIKTLEVVIPQLERIEELSERGRAIYFRTLFELPVVKEVLVARNITEKDDPELLKEKLENLLQEFEEENKLHAPEEQLPPQIPRGVPELVEKRVKKLNDEINRLVEKRSNNEEYIERERPKVEEALGKLVVFGSDINPQEKVSIGPAEDGSLEIIFESDRDETEALQAIRTDIQGCRTRIAEYDRAIVEKGNEGSKGFLEKIFPRKKNSEPEDVARNPLQGLSIEELEGKKGRTEQMLVEVVQDYEARSKELQNKIQKTKEALEVALVVTGTDVFVGSWQDLVMRLKVDCEKFLEDLEASLAQYDEDITTLEQKRDRLIQQAS